MEIIMILLLLLPVIFIGLIVYVMKVYDNTNDENNKSDKITVEIGDVFVYEPLRLMTNPFEDVPTVRDVDSRTYIVDDLKINYEGVV